MQRMMCIVLTAGLLALAGCGATGTVQGDGSEKAAYGHVKMGVPF